MNHPTKPMRVSQRAGFFMRGMARAGRVNTAIAIVVGALASPAYAQERLGPPPPAEEKARPKNRLAKETSPYLLLHAHNPVDWYAWGPEALERAKKEQKLIFLSIGYSSCYWCHVMERESFMDEEIARLLNENFVCIKVDREERPEIDEIYMTALQVYSRQSGGWPLSMFLTPEARPFAGGTYFPARDNDRPGHAGFLTVVHRILGFWKENPDQVQAQGAQIADLVKDGLRNRNREAVEWNADEAADGLMDQLADEFDARFGGFSYNEANPRVPKFPEPANMAFLLDRFARKKDARARDLLIRTLDAMAAGGIHDQVGGGFHRYSTDRYWRVPHFEKMLYDNAQLASLYAEASQIAERAGYRQVVDRLLAFVLRELTDAEGAFYSALDAQTDGVEGKFYVWTHAELSEALSPEQLKLAADAYGIRGMPNFEDAWVLNESKTAAQIARERGTPTAGIEQGLGEIRGVLLNERAKRPRPPTDVKVLTAWNGMMIRGFADAGRVFSERSYVESATRAAEAVLSRLRGPDGRLSRSLAGGEVRHNAYLDDYAFLADGLIALHEATGDERWLKEADLLMQKLIELFWDAEDGGFFLTSGDHEELIARSKPMIDSSTPSGNAMAAGNLLYLARALDRPEYLEKVDGVLRAAAGVMSEFPTAAPRMALVGVWRADK
jgi:hypothetical protein